MAFLVWDDRIMTMRNAVSAAVITLLASSVAYAAPLADYISSAMTAPIRQGDRADDSRRHGAEIAALAGIKPSERVLTFYQEVVIGPVSSLVSLVLRARYWTFGQPAWSLQDQRAKPA